MKRFWMMFAVLFMILSVAAGILMEEPAGNAYAIRFNTIALFCLLWNLNMELL